MKAAITLFLAVALAACGYKNSTTGNKAVPSRTASAARDSTEQMTYRLLKEYAVCRCLSFTPEGRSLGDADISPSVYANILHYAGVDTLNALARSAGEKIAPERYLDYGGKRAAFFRCNRWAESPTVDSLIRRYAAYSIADEVWEMDSLPKK